MGWGVKVEKTGSEILKTYKKKRDEELRGYYNRKREGKRERYWCRKREEELRGSKYLNGRRKSGGIRIEKRNLIARCQ